MSKLNQIYFLLQAKIARAKEKIREEKGAVDLITIVILIAVVVAVAVIFKDSISRFVKEMLDKLFPKGEEMYN